MLLWRDELQKPQTLFLFSYRRKWCDNVDPTATRAERNKVILRVHEVQGTQKSGCLFPLPILRRPIDAVSLPVAEQIGKLFLSLPQVDFKLAGSENSMLSKNDDHIFKGLLSASESFGSGE